MIKEQFAEVRYGELEREIAEIIEGRLSIESLTVNLGKKLNDFAIEIDKGRVPFEYLEKTMVLAGKLNNYCLSTK